MPGPGRPIQARPLAGAAALGAVLVAVAGLLDAEPLYVPGIAFLALSAAAAVLVLGGGRGVTVTRTVSVRRAVEDEPVLVDVVVRSPRPLPTGVVADDLLPEPAPLAAGRRVSGVRLRVRFARRGRKRLAPTRVAVRDPFALLTRVVTGAHEDEILILPRVERVGPPDDGGSGDGVSPRRGRPSVAAEIELDGLRQHRPGTPASRIFWPSLARGGELLERRLLADSDTRPLVVLDPRGAAVEEDLDAAVRAAASLAVHLAREGGCAMLVPGDRRPVLLDRTLAGWPHLHARLALVDGSSPPALGGVATRRGPIFYVAARRLTRPPRALAHAPGGGRLLVVPGRMPARRASFSVAGCHGYELSARGAPAEAA
jgi:uncharacterized protein (DUF58 family)